MAEFPNNTPELLCAKYAILKECCPPEIELHLAAEYMLDDGFEGIYEGNVIYTSRQAGLG